MVTVPIITLLILITLLTILQLIIPLILILTILRITILQITLLLTTQRIQQIIKHRSTLQAILSVLVKSAPKNITSLPTSPVYNAPLPNPIVSHAI